MITHSSRWSHPPGNTVVPSPWQATSSRSTLRSPSSCQIHDDEQVAREPPD